jgi:predicted CopG family antitoxin
VDASVNAMATKTISVDLEAYRRLVQARKHSHESFSQVIKRAKWEESDYTREAILAALERLKPLEDAVIHELGKAQKQNKPPSDKWQKEKRSLRGKLRWNGDLEKMRRDRNS